MLLIPLVYKAIKKYYFPGIDMYYKLRKKLLRFIQTINKSCILHRPAEIEYVTPKIKLDYLRCYRYYIKALKDNFEVSYE